MKKYKTHIKNNNNKAYEYFFFIKNGVSSKGKAFFHIGDYLSGFFPISATFGCMVIMNNWKIE